MWPYRPRRLSDLLDAPEIGLLLGYGVSQLLRSDVAVFEPSPEGGAVAIEPPADLTRLHESPFCHLLRHGQISGARAFDGADAECARCELKLATRVLESAGGRSTAGGGDRNASRTASTRCHMGLLDMGTPVLVRGVPLAAVIAGRRVESPEDRVRIVKRVGKIGKLTRGEVRSLEESGSAVVAAIRPREDRARELLTREVADIPQLDGGLDDNLERLADLLATLAEGRYELARRSWEDRLLARVVAEGSELPQRRAIVLRWVEGAVRRLHRLLGNRFVALFARLPEDLGKTDQPLRLLAQSGLTSDARVDLRDETPAMSLDATTVVEPAETLEECVGRALEGASSLISALRPTAACPETWKDDLTKSIFVAACRECPGLEIVVAFGPANADPVAEPRRDDFSVLWRAARRIGERYLLAACESVRRADAVRLERFDKVALAKKPTGPLRPQRFDVRKLLVTAVSSLSTEAEKRGVTFDTRALPEKAMLEADRKKLMDVFACLLHYIIDVAVPNSTGDRPSVVLSIRRHRRDRRRWIIVFDIVGRFLTSQERRRLFSPANGARTEPDATTPSSAVSFREAQQSVSWHRGRLKVESERITQEEDTDRTPGSAQWTGRTLITIDIPERAPRHPLPVKGETARQDEGHTPRDGGSARASSAVPESPSRRGRGRRQRSREGPSREGPSRQSQ